MSNCRIVSICFTDLYEWLKKGHSCGTRSANGKIYVGLKIQDKKEKDQYNHDVAVLLNPSEAKRGTKDQPGPEDGIFIGNGIKLVAATEENSPQNPFIDQEDDIAF